MVAQDIQLKELRQNYITQYNESNRLDFCKIAMKQLHWVNTKTSKVGDYVIQDNFRREILQSYIDSNTAPSINKFTSILEMFSLEELSIIGF